MSFTIRSYTGEVAWQKAEPQHFGMNTVIGNIGMIEQKEAHFFFRRFSLL